MKQKARQRGGGGLSIGQFAAILLRSYRQMTSVRSSMKFSALHRSRHQIAVVAAALALALLAAPAARAFTMTDQGNTNSDGSAKLADPSDQAGRFGSSGSGTTYRQGNTTFQFGPLQQDSSDARFNSDAARLFNPLGRPGDPGR